MKSEGQAWAIDQLNEIARASEGAVEIVEISEPTEEGGKALVTFSVNCAAYEHKAGGTRFKSRERLIVHIEPNFPLDVPRVYFSHKR
jgi:hypothetical protein